MSDVQTYLNLTTRRTRNMRKTREIQTTSCHMRFTVQREVLPRPHGTSQKEEEKKNSSSQYIKKFERKNIMQGRTHDLT